MKLRIFFLGDTQSFIYLFYTTIGKEFKHQALCDLQKMLRPGQPSWKPLPGCMEFSLTFLYKPECLSRPFVTDVVWKRVFFLRSSITFVRIQF